MAFSPNGEYLTSGSSDDTICIWRVSSGERVKILTGHSDTVNSVVFLYHTKNLKKNLKFYIY